MRFKSKWKKIITIVLPVLVVLLGCVLFIRYQQGQYAYTTAAVTEVYSGDKVAIKSAKNV